MNLVNEFVNFAIESKYLIVTDTNVNVTTTGKFLYAGLVSLFCLSIYLTVALLCTLLSKTYKGLKLKDKMFWNLAFVRCIYGTIGVVGGLYVRAYDAIGPHSLSLKTIPSNALVLAHMGFFIFECSAQTYFDIKFKTFSKELHMHHILALVGYFNASYYDLNHHMACTIFILEMTTPFSCICWCLIKANMQHSFIWKANQFVLVHLFHLRSVLEFITIYEHFKFSDEYSKMPISMASVQYFGLFAVAFYLTPYWTYRKTQQMFNPVDIAELAKKPKKQADKKE